MTHRRRALDTLFDDEHKPITILVPSYKEDRRVIFSNPDVGRPAGIFATPDGVVGRSFTQHNATYWVGANALLRRTARKEITVREVERGYAMQRFIQDRTVIEDTESSVDLADRACTAIAAYGAGAI